MKISTINHLSFLCRSLEDSTKFYTKLGFVKGARPSAFTLEGVWLHGHGISIHLLLADPEKDLEKLPKNSDLDPKKNHIAFQCDDTETAGEGLRKELAELGIGDVYDRTFVEGEVSVRQIFFHDPDGYMVEICNCTDLPVRLIGADTLATPAESTPETTAVEGTEDSHASAGEDEIPHEAGAQNEAQAKGANQAAGAIP